MQTVMVAAGQIASSLLALLLISMLARAFDPHDLGIYLYYVATATALEGLTDLGLRLRGVAALAAGTNSESRDRILDWLWLLKIGLSVLTILAILAATAAGWIRYTGLPTAVMIGLVSVSLPSSSPAAWDLRASGYQWLEAVLLVAYRALLILIVFWLGSRLDAQSMLGVLLVSNLVLQLTLIMSSSRTRPETIVAGSVAGQPERWRLLASAIPLGSSLFISQFAPRIWIFWLAVIGTPADVANLTVAMMLIQTTVLIPVAASAAYLPTLSRLARDSGPQFFAVTASLIEAMAIFGSAVALAIALAAKGVVPVILGESLQSAVVLVVALAILPPALFISFLSRVILTALDAGALDLRSALSGAVLGIVTATVLLKLGLGTWALVAGFLTSEIAACGLRVAVLRKRLDRHSTVLLRIARPVVLALAVTTSIAVIAGLPGSAPGAIAGACCGLILFGASLAAVPSIRRQGFSGLLP
jgi:O-antigen/teichoic acid export membrane protein